MEIFKLNLIYPKMFGYVYIYLKFSISGKVYNGRTLRQNSPGLTALPVNQNPSSIMQILQCLGLKDNIAEITEHTSLITRSTSHKKIVSYRTI